MSLADLPTLQETQAVRRAVQKSQMVSRLDEKVTSDRDDARALEQWATSVRFRDRERCRVCGIKTVRTLELDPKRGEAHHIVSRTCKVTRTDRRNGLWTCLRCHRRFKARTLFVIGTARQMFTVGKAITAKSYLNGDEHLSFTERNPT